MDKIKDRCLRMLSLGKDNNNIPKIGVLNAFLIKHKKTIGDDTLTLKQIDSTTWHY